VGISSIIFSGGDRWHEVTPIRKHAAAKYSKRWWDRIDMMDYMLKHDLRKSSETSNRAFGPSSDFPKIAMPFSW
jgi:hypothetical protein